MSKSSYTAEILSLSFSFVALLSSGKISNIPKGSSHSNFLNLGHRRINGKAEDNTTIPPIM
jgi:hypothetical protein